MTLILTNDDGIDAPGIRALLKAVEGQKVIVAAPVDHLSGCGHQVTTTKAINVHRRSVTEYAIAGTPADCTRIALSHLCPEAKFVLSGINAGGNMGADVYISGTVAAVREAAFHGVNGIAISHYLKGKKNVDWDTAARWTKQVLADLMNRSRSWDLLEYKFTALRTGRSRPRSGILSTLYPTIASKLPRRRE